MNINCHNIVVRSHPDVSLQREHKTPLTHSHAHERPIFFKCKQQLHNSSEPLYAHKEQRFLQYKYIAFICGTVTNPADVVRCRSCRRRVFSHIARSSSSEQYVNRFVFHIFSSSKRQRGNVNSNIRTFCNIDTRWICVFVCASALCALVPPFLILSSICRPLRRRPSATHLYFVSFGN